MKNLHHCDGSDVSLRDWNMSQADSARLWSLTRRMSSNDRLFAWQAFFSEDVRRLCGEFNVPVDVCHEILRDVQEDIVPDVDDLKWFLSVQQGRDVGLIETAQSTRSQFQPLLDAVGFEKRFPHIDKINVYEPKPILFPTRLILPYTFKAA